MSEEAGRIFYGDDAPDYTGFGLQQFYSPDEWREACLRWEQEEDEERSE